MKITIDVTAEDIRCGQRQTSGSCPIALALIRSGLRNPHVYHNADAYIGAPALREWLLLPAEAASFIYRFDDEESVEPFSFELDVPDELAPAGESR